MSPYLPETPLKKKKIRTLECLLSVFFQFPPNKVHLGTGSMIPFIVARDGAEALPGTMFSQFFLFSPSLLLEVSIES